MSVTYGNEIDFPHRGMLGMDRMASSEMVCPQEVVTVKKETDSTHRSLQSLQQLAGVDSTSPDSCRARLSRQFVSRRRGRPRCLARSQSTAARLGFLHFPRTNGFPVSIFSTEAAAAAAYRSPRLMMRCCGGSFLVREARKGNGEMITEEQCYRPATVDQA